MSGGPPFSIDYDSRKYDEIKEGPAGPSHVVLSKVSFFSRVDVGNDGTRLNKIDWEAARSSILPPPAGGAMRPSPYTGIIHDISRSELDVLGFDKRSQTASYLVSVHFSACREFVVWDADSPHSPQPLTSPAELIVRDATLDKLEAGHGELQLWHGNTYICDAYRKALGRCNETFFHIDAARITVQKIVDGEPRDTAAARREAAGGSLRRASKLRAAFEEHGLEMPCDHPYIAYGKRACGGLTPAVLAADAAHLKYLREFVPAFNAKVEELEAAVEAGLDDTLQQFAEKEFEREYDDDDKDMVDYVEDYRDNYDDYSSLWEEICGPGESSRDDHERQLMRTSYSARPAVWPWLACGREIITP
jgi:hypothetical protein